MSGTYESALPNVFPYVAEMSESLIPEIAAMLSKARPGVPYGSSFAVTSDVHKPGKRRVWLSKVSYDTIKTNLPELGFQVEVAI